MDLSQACGRRKKRFIEEHGFAKFACWHLGEDDEQAPNSKHRYQFSLLRQAPADANAPTSTGPRLICVSCSTH